MYSQLFYEIRLEQSIFYQQQYQLECESKRIIKHSVKYNPKIRYLAAVLIQKNCYNWMFKVPDGNCI